MDSIDEQFEMYRTRITELERKLEAREQEIILNEGMQEIYIKEIVELKQQLANSVTFKIFQKNCIIFKSLYFEDCRNNCTPENCPLKGKADD